MNQEARDAMHSAAQQERAKLVDIKLLPDMKSSDVPSRGIERVVGNIIAKGYVTVLAGAGGASKSTLLLGMAMGITTGTSTVGPTVPEAATVLYCQLEDDHATVERAVRAAAQARHMEDGDMKMPLRAVGRDVLHKVMKLARDQTMQMIVMDTETRTPVVQGEIEEKFRQFV